jgi:hypothetical protein
MNTDRDLLEMAAKAAGLRVICHASYPQGGVYVDDMEDDWNPLTDDGDALRLAVKLDLTYYDVKEEEWHQDRYAATRLAIVRAAAEIGKEMK